MGFFDISTAEDIELLPNTLRVLKCRIWAPTEVKRWPNLRTLQIRFMLRTVGEERSKILSRLPHSLVELTLDLEQWSNGDGILSNLPDSIEKLTIDNAVFEFTEVKELPRR